MSRADIKQALGICALVLGTFLSVATITLMAFDCFSFYTQTQHVTTAPMSVALPIFAFPLYLVNIGVMWGLTPARSKLRLVLCLLAATPFAIAAVVVWV